MDNTWQAKLIGDLNPKFFKDGDQFCFLLGENLQEGIAGFGDTAAAAMEEFCEKFYRETISEKVDKKVDKNLFKEFLESKITIDPCDYDEYNRLANFLFNKGIFYKDERKNLIIKNIQELRHQLTANFFYYDNGYFSIDDHRISGKYKLVDINDFLGN